MIVKRISKGVYLDDAVHRPNEQIEVVQIYCKDCKYFKFGNGCFLQSVDYEWEEQMYADDFCSRGERKDD